MSNTPLSHSRHRPLRVRAAGAVLVAAALGAPAAALAGNNPSFKASVPFSGGRTTDLRVGEPLEFSFHGHTISKVCWSPAPIQRPACGTGFAAPSKAGTQQLRVTLAGGKTFTEHLTIGPRATTLPASVAEAGTANARVVEYKATCNADGYATVSGGSLSGERKELAMKKGDRLAAYYRAGDHAVNALRYGNPIPGFYNTHCLKLVG